MRASLVWRFVTVPYGNSDSVHYGGDTVQVAISVGRAHGKMLSLSLREKVTHSVAQKPVMKKRKAVVQVVRPEHLERVLDAIREPYRTMMLLQWAVGLRPGEVCKMRLCDINTDTGDLITPRDGKTGERHLGFDTSGRFAEALASWMLQRPAGPYLFGGEQPIRVNTYNVTVHRACARVGVPEFRPYALRHTYATELIRANQPISDVSAALGHQSVLTTARYYLHADPEMIRRLNKGR